MIEIEKRILLNKDAYQKLNQFFLEHSRLEKNFKRFTMVQIGRSDFKADPDKLLDLRVRTTGEEGTLTAKYGNWHADSAREEYEVHFQTDEIQSLFHILILQKYLYFIMSYIERSQYKYEDFVITIDKYFSMDAYLMEIELSVTDASEVSTAENKIDTFLQTYHLDVLNSDSTKNFIQKMNDVEALQVDFTKISVETWFEKWKESIYCRKAITI